MVYSAEETDVALCPSEKVIWYSYVTVEKKVSVSVQGYEVGCCSSVVMVRLASSVKIVGS